MSLPIRFQEHVQLTSLGIAAASIGFNTLTMESDRWICVREQVGDQHQVVIVDLQGSAAPTRRPITADAAAMAPHANVIALKAGRQLQVFDLDRKAKLKAWAMAEDVVFWTWTSPTNIALVTDSAVYHWPGDGDAPPKKMFDRHASLAGAQIISYRANSVIKS